MDTFRYRCHTLKPLNAFQNIETEQRLQRESCSSSEPVSNFQAIEMEENSIYDTAESGKPVHVTLTTHTEVIYDYKIILLFTVHLPPLPPFCLADNLQIVVRLQITWQKL